LSGDPEAKNLRPFNDQNTPLPTEKAPRKYIHPVFSSRGSLEALQWYAKKMESAKSGVFLTAAFGISKEFRSVLEEDKPYLRYILLDKPGKGLDLIGRHHNNMISIGGVLNDNALDNWLDTRWRAEKLTGLNSHVQYIHTKYMLIDPMGDDPMLITGSANFSENSTRNNDENMVIIRGNKRVTDMYLGEFMRLYDHFRFRGTKLGANATDRKGTHPQIYLADDDSWTKKFFQKGSQNEMQKMMFRGY
jgi:phosphatidylserine/phosphatidylglycerophosphate/cardiolipin synthase-like enzyme